VNPQTGTVVSCASDERILQANMESKESESSTILAIQGVSRIERMNAIGHGMESAEFQKGQVRATSICFYS
jgi:hypothetical protein